MTDEPNAEYVTVNTYGGLHDLGDDVAIRDATGSLHTVAEMLWSLDEDDCEGYFPATVLVPAPTPQTPDDGTVNASVKNSFTDADDVREVLALAFSKFRDGMVPYPYDYELADVALSAIPKPTVSKEQVEAAAGYLPGTCDGTDRHMRILTTECMFRAAGIEVAE